jgi:hypothetical protein
MAVSISTSLRTGAMIGTTLSDRAAVSNEGLKVDTGAVSRLNMKATRQLKSLAAQRGFVVAEAGDVPSLLHDLVPKAATITALFDPRPPSGQTIMLPDVRDAAAALGQKLLVLEASISLP